jgi:hypothetical protein
MLTLKTLDNNALLAKGFQDKLALLAKIHKQSLISDAQNLYFSSCFLADQQIIVRTSNRVNRRSNWSGITCSQKTSQCYVSFHDVLNDLFLCL